MASRIIVKNLPKHATDARLREFFAAVGEITDCRIQHLARIRHAFVQKSQNVLNAAPADDDQGFGIQRRRSEERTLQTMWRTLENRTKL